MGVRPLPFKEGVIMREPESYNREGFPRDEVMRFAYWMERKLKMNDHKGGWEDMTPAELSTRCMDELTELRLKIMEASQEGLSKQLCEMIRDEAADVANFAMMVAENVDNMRPA